MDDSSALVAWLNQDYFEQGTMVTTLNDEERFNVEKELFDILLYATCSGDVRQDTARILLRLYDI
jgi:hypothetical protein